jgi:hypothetical protein
MESDEWSVSKIKAEGRTVCLFEQGGKLDAAGALCNAAECSTAGARRHASKRIHTIQRVFRSAAQRRLERTLHGRASIIDWNRRFATFLFPSGCDD